MNLDEPAQSPYDLHLRLLDFQIRVSWTFWAAAAVLGYGLASNLDLLFGEESLGVIPLLALWAVCIFVSIGIHELGHALAFRRYGIESRIVLYFMGGMAIPTRYSGVHEGLKPLQSMWVALAGPVAQLASAFAMILLFSAASYAWPIPWPLDQLTWLDGLADGKPIDSVGLYAIALMYLQPSISWAILNLIPVWPLDGGRVIHSLVQLQGGNISTTLFIGLIASALVALFAFQNGLQFLGFMFLILGWNNYQAVQQLNHYK